jgi:structure-specific recognition protein 1
MASRRISKGDISSAEANSTPAKLMETFENVYLDLSKQSGRCRFAESGLGWKPKEGDTYTLDKSNIANAQWSRAARGYEIKLLTRNGDIVQLDGFQEHVIAFLPTRVAQANLVAGL